jgi:cytochrome c nitrite reductase small subunit
LRAVSPETPAPRARPLILAAALTGVFLGIVAFTFHYADGLSYFSTDPKACANCHIMNDQYASWSRGPHHGDAGCVDCHLPHDTIPKYIAKASNGYHHSKGFTLQDFHEPILIKPRNAEILQGNCMRCHGDFVHEALGAQGNREEVRCTHCHRGVGHGARG